MESQGTAPSNGTRRHPTTIYDIARETGVSPSTVSRALNKPGRINANTEARIRAAADKLGYRGNPMARALPTGRTGTIAVLLSDITNPVYFDLIRGAERVAALHGNTLVLAESQESAERERDAAERLQPSVDGIVLVASRLEDDAIRSLAEVKPIVLVNREVDGIPSLHADISPGLTDAVDELTSLGHRSIGYLAGPQASWMNRRRWNLLFQLAVERGLSIVEIAAGDPTMEGGRAALDRVLASGVSAIITYNDLMALGLLRECPKRGVRVAGRLSIIGFDDIFGADLTTPALTTIRTPLTALGEAAVTFLAGGRPDDADEPPAPPHTTFVRRESHGAPDVH